MLAQTLGTLEILVLLLYVLVVVYLGVLGWRRTKSAADYLLAGRKAHPAIMALSYGATFISTSAIVGCGGVAGLFGMSLLWLTFCNIFVGIFIAFVLLGGPTRRMGHRLDAHTFSELLGRRYDSKFIQVFGGLLIFLFIPLYAAAVLIGGCEFIATSFSIDYRVALLIFSIVVAAYVIAGGLKGVMYTDALQGTIMFVGMAFLLVWTYALLGGPMAAHQALAEAKTTAFAGFKGVGFRGWTEMPVFGWGKKENEFWWTVVSTIVLGVGIGVLAQPQLMVRFMTVKSKRELNRAVGIGGIFILTMTGVAFTVGALSNLYFAKHEVITASIVQETPQAKVFAKKEPGLEAALPARLLH
ncbi:MAG: sodium:solute symporter family protein, partial [Syntrophobacterales bacterium]